MTEQHDHQVKGTDDMSGGAPNRHGGHGLMMIACCVPMLVIAGVLVATGAVSFGFLIVAVLCTAMMALMMRGMHGGGHGSSSSQAGPTHSTVASHHPHDRNADR